MTTQRTIRNAAALVLAALCLAGCSAAQVTENLPSQYGGLPQGTPARPNTPLNFPAVHDMPPARQDTTLNEEEKTRLQRDLNATRERQDRLTAQDKKETPASAKAAKPKAAPAASPNRNP